MKVTLKGNVLHIEVEANITNPPISKSQKSKLVASASGKTTVMVGGKPLVVSLNAYVPV